MKTEKILWGVAIVGFLVGLIGLFQRITGGHTVAAYNTYVPWGLWVALYTMLIGVSVGAYFVVTLVYGFRVKALQSVGRIALLTAFAALVGGLLAVWLDLGHPMRFFKLFFSTSFTSVMGVMTWLYTIYGILLVVLFYLLSKNGETPAVRILTWLGLALVVVFGGAEGSLFGVVSARALWDSGLTPILFLAEGTLSGVALVLFLAAILNKLEIKAGQILRWTVLGLLLAVIVLKWAEFSTALYAGLPAKAESLNVILFGPFWWVFWLINVGLGLVVPLLLLIFAGRNQAALATAGGLVAFSAISAKLNLVIPALVVPEFEGLRTAFSGFGLTFDYFPTVAEWLLTIWVVSIAGLIFLALYHFLPSPSGEQAG